MKHAYKQFCTAETCNMCAKVCQRGLQTPTTWPTSLANISGKLRVRNCQSIKFFKFFKVKSLTNQIRAVITRSYVYGHMHCPRRSFIQVRNAASEFDKNIFGLRDSKINLFDFHKIKTRKFFFIAQRFLHVIYLVT